MDIPIVVDVVKYAESDLKYSTSLFVDRRPGEHTDQIKSFFLRPPFPGLLGSFQVYMWEHEPVYMHVFFSMCVSNLRRSRLQHCVPRGRAGVPATLCSFSVSCAEEWRLCGHCRPTNTEGNKNTPLYSTVSGDSTMHPFSDSRGPVTVRHSCSSQRPPSWQYKGPASICLYSVSPYDRFWRMLGAIKANLMSCECHTTFEIVMWCVHWTG